MSDEDLPQDVKDLQRDIIIDLLGKAKRRFKRSVGDNLKLAFHYERGKRFDSEDTEDLEILEETEPLSFRWMKGKPSRDRLHNNIRNKLRNSKDYLKAAFRYEYGRRLDPNVPEDKEKLEKIMPADYFVKKGIHVLAERIINHYGEDWFKRFGLDQYGNPLRGNTIGDVRQLHENFQERKVSRALEDAKHFARRVEKSPIGTGTRKFSSAIGPAITKYTEKLAGYNEDRLEQFGYNKDGRKFAEVTPPKPTSKAGEFLKKVPGELNKDLKKAADELDRDFRAAFHYTKGKRLDSKNSKDKEVLEARMPMEYWIKKNATYGEEKWFNKKFGLMETGDPMLGKTRTDVEALYDKFDKTKKSAAYEALKNFKNGKIGKYGWSDLGRSLYHGVEKIGDGILYFPRRHWERERRDLEEWKEIGLTQKAVDYVENKIDELRAADEARKQRLQAVQQGQIVAPMVAGGGTVIHHQYLINFPSPGEYTVNLNHRSLN